MDPGVSFSHFPFSPVTANEEYILELLQDSGLVNGSQVFEAREHVTANGGSVVEALIAGSASSPRRTSPAPSRRPPTWSSSI